MEKRAGENLEIIFPTTPPSSRILQFVPQVPSQGENAEQNITMPAWSPVRAEAGDGSWEGDRMAVLAVPTAGQTALPGQSKAAFNPSLGCTVGNGE